MRQYRIEFSSHYPHTHHTITKYIFAHDRADAIQFIKGVYRAMFSALISARLVK